MSKAATEVDKNADRADRPKPTMRERVPYECVEGHGVTNPRRVVSNQFAKPRIRSSIHGPISAGAIKIAPTASRITTVPSPAPLRGPG